MVPGGEAPSIKQLKPPPRDFLLAFASAALLVFSFPKHDLSALAWIGLVPLFIALRGASSRRAFGLSFAMGISFLMGIYYWINVLDKFELTDFLLLGIYLGAYFGVFGLALNYLTRQSRYPIFLIAPCIWVALEYLRSLGGWLALPWPFLGYSQYLNARIIQIASLTGVYGVSFLIVMCNAALAEIVANERRRGEVVSRLASLQVFAPAIITATLVGASLLYGSYQVANSPPRGHLRVAVIQGNIPQELRWKPDLRETNLEKHMLLSRKAAGDGQLSLIVWPETTVQGSIEQNKDLLKTLASVAADTRAHILVGSAELPKFGSGRTQSVDTSNSAFLISPDGKITGRYDKIRLLPFGEYLPFKIFPWPARIASAWQAGEFKAGSEYALLPLDGVNVAATICWENIFPDLVRQFAKKGANLAINITNEAWFGETSAAYQFLTMSVFRAVENRISIARAANTGVSGFIDPFGRILGTVKKGDKDLFVEGYLVENIPLAHGVSFYANYGDLFALVCVGLVLASVLFSLARTNVQ